MPEKSYFPLDNATQIAYSALTRWVLERQGDDLRVLGINGAQGSGKSTLAQYLVKHLADDHGLYAVAISLDDFYLSLSVRSELANRIHPLLQTRGVPGTHDVQRGIDCLHQLRTLTASQRCALPQFSKALDDALPANQDRIISRQPDLVIFEGWCVGTPAQQSAELVAPINALEKTLDPDGVWRRYVNEQLASTYAQWYAQLDALVYLQVPSWEQVRQWRGQQERETAAGNHGVSALTQTELLDRFLQHYQRLTRHALEVLPQRADVVLKLDEQHAVAQALYR